MTEFIHILFLALIRQRNDEIFRKRVESTEYSVRDAQTKEYLSSTRNFDASAIRIAAAAPLDYK